jgi:hypothetical protein
LVFNGPQFLIDGLEHGVSEDFAMFLVYDHFAVDVHPDGVCLYQKAAVVADGEVKGLLRPVHEMNCPYICGLVADCCEKFGGLADIGHLEE